jgi:hypothetical protein
MLYQGKSGNADFEGEKSLTSFLIGFIASTATTDETITSVRRHLLQKRHFEIYVRARVARFLLVHCTKNMKNIQTNHEICIPNDHKIYPKAIK